MAPSRILLKALFIPLFSAISGSLTARAAVAPDRLAHLRRGINLSGWFQYLGPDENAALKAFSSVGPSDLSLIRSLGFDHVRIALDPVPILKQNSSKIEAAIAMALDHELAVVVDVHPGADFLSRLSSDDGAVRELQEFWLWLAALISRTDPKRVFLGILNEPVVTDRHRWTLIQSGLVAAIRTKAPDHTLVASGPGYSTPEDFVAMAPLQDTNVIYDFHFYRPGIFTHQGTTWALGFYKDLKFVPYPLGPKNAPAILSQISAPQDRKKFRDLYGSARWDKNQMEALVKQMADWAGKWGVPVLCEEFGVYRKNARPAHRASWLRDLRLSLEKFGIGWAMWEYQGGFGLVTKTGKNTAVDPLALKALGLGLTHKRRKPTAYR